MNRKKEISQLNQEIKELEFGFQMPSLELDSDDCDNFDIEMEAEDFIESYDSDIASFRKQCRSLKNILDDADFKDKVHRLHADIEKKIVELDSIEIDLSDYRDSLNDNEYTEI